MIQYYSITLFILLLSCFSSACKKPDIPSKHYLFLAHCYQWGAPDNNRIDKRLNGLDYSQYDQIWLGGDLCARTAEQPATLAYLDSLLYISNPTTHWAVGNHDLVNSNLSKIERATGRSTFYTSHSNGLTILVLNTTLNHPQLPATGQCAELAAQLQLIRDVTDTIQESSHLILLHHHALLTNELADNTLDMDTLWHYYRPNLSMDCVSGGSFQNLIYPLLAKVQTRGIQVLLIGGDVGQRCKSFEFQTKEGVWFLGSGINNSMGRVHVPPWVTNFEPDQILLLKHEPEKRKLRWHFEPLNKYIQHQQGEH